MAGEASGDHHGAAFVAALRERLPNVSFAGTGGERMKEQGVELIAELDKLAVMGFVEVLPRVPYFLRLEARVLELIEARRPELVVLVDYPGFNMRIAKAAHDRGCRVLYYIAPQVWAWKRGRARTLARVTNAIAVILPFEADLLRSYGANAEYVGHPLLDRKDDVPDRAAWLAECGLDPSRPLLALLPGSREQELDRHLDAFVEIGQAVAGARPEVQVVCSRAEAMSSDRFRGVSVPVVTDTRALLRWADAALVKSGTSTLETALERTPFVIGYRTSAVTALVARKLLKVDHIGLPNLIVDERVVPEFYQEEVCPAVVAPLLLELLDQGSERRARQLLALDRVNDRLGNPGASGRVADLALELIGSGT